MFSKALADSKVSCNVIAGYNHDHIFVNYEKKELAMKILKRLSFNYEKYIYRTSQVCRRVLYKTYVFYFKVGLKLILWGFIAIIHAMFPFIFKTYVSSNIKKLHDDIFLNRLNK